MKIEIQRSVNSKNIYIYTLGTVRLPTRIWVAKGTGMARKRYTAEQIIAKQRQAEVVLAQGESVAWIRGGCDRRPDALLEADDDIRAPLGSARNARGSAGCRKSF